MVTELNQNFKFKQLQNHRLIIATSGLLIDLAKGLILTSLIALFQNQRLYFGILGFGYGCGFFIWAIYLLQGDKYANPD